MKKYRDLADYFEYRGRRFAERCTNCGACLEVCPVYPLTGLAGKDPKAVIEKITDLLKGGSVSDEAYEMVFACNGGCDICSKACPEKLNPYSAFTSAIAQIAKSGKQPPPQVYQVIPKHRPSFTRVFSALQSQPSERRWLSRAPANPRPAEIVLFAGCSATGMMHTFLETMGILDKMGTDYVALGGDELCCGTAAMLWGDLDAAQLRKVFESGAWHLAQSMEERIPYYWPWVGVLVFTSARVAKADAADVFRAALPFILSILAVLMLVTYVPSLSLFLPDLIGP